MQANRTSRLNSHKDFLRSQSVVRKRRKRFLRRLIVRSVLLIILIGSITWASWLEQFAILKVVVAGTSEETSKKIQEEANELIGQKYFGIIPKKNFLLYPKKEIVKKILDAHPEINAAGIGTEHVHTLNIRVMERKPVALWCQGETCYMMDDKAYVYSLAAGNGESLLHIYDMMATTSDPLKTEPIPAKTFSGMVAVAAELSSSSLPVERISIAEDGQYIFKIENNGRIIFSSRKPLDQSYLDLVSALRSPVFAKSKEFQYIDARFGNKVFYRLGGDKETAFSTTTASSTEAI